MISQRYSYSSIGYKRSHLKTSILGNLIFQPLQKRMLKVMSNFEFTNIFTVDGHHPLVRFIRSKKLQEDMAKKTPVSYCSSCPGSIFITLLHLSDYHEISFLHYVLRIFKRWFFTFHQIVQHVPMEPKSAQKRITGCSLYQAVHTGDHFACSCTIPTGDKSRSHEVTPTWKGVIDFWEDKNQTWQK